MTSLAATQENALATLSGPFSALLNSLHNSIEVVRNAKANNVDYDAGSDSVGNGEYRVVRDIIIGVAETMENTSTKFSVSMDCGMSNEMIESLCKSTKKPAEQLTTACIVAARCNCTLTLRDEIYSSIEICLVAMRQLVDAASRSEVEKLPMITGQVWEACKNLRKLPSTNKACIKRKVLLNYRNVNDVCKEVNEMIKEHEENQGSSTGNSTVDMGFDDFGEDDFFYNSSMSPVEYQRCKLSIPIFKLLVDTFKCTIKIFSIAECKCSGSNEILDYIALNSGNMLDKTNEIGVVLYAPQVLNNLRNAITEAVDTCAEFLQQLLALLDLELGDANSNQTESLDNSRRIIEQLLNASESLPSSLFDADEFKE